MKKLYALDFMGILYASHYAYINLSHNGALTGGIYGVTKTILDLLDQKPDYFIVALDSSKSFREELYPQYKANRKTRPEEITSQIEVLRQIIPKLGVHAIGYEGYEADDIIASVCKQFVSPETEGVIHSDDKDLMQLITPFVSQFSPRKQKVYREPEVMEKFGVPTNKISEFLALQGDSSDNIPGAKGIGPKSAAAMINSYGSIDNLYKNLGLLKPAYREKLEKSIELVSISKQLTELVSDLDIGVLGDYEVKPIDKSVIKLLESYGMQSFIERLSV